MRGLGPFDLVLCRNVLIYFDLPTRKTVLEGLRNTLTPGGYLLLGASETTHNLDVNFARKTIRNVVCYQIARGGMRLP
jgi:chemotaxis protein methyltransferase CheR